MKYFVMYKGYEQKEEISKEDAKRYLTGNWKDEYLEKIFSTDVHFRLWTPFSEIWTEDNGVVPMAGFYGTVEEI